MFVKTKKLCDSFLEMGVPGFDLAVYKDGECVLRYMNGYSDLENKIPMKGNERYNIYSCSKIATVTAALSFMNRDIFCLMIRFMSLSPNLRKCTYKMRTVSLKRRKIRLL